MASIIQVRDLSKAFFVTRRKPGLGGAMNIRAVPTIFINGRRLEGVPEAKLLERVLSRELNRN